MEITILDEADEMADMGFLPPVTRLLEQTDSRGQRMLFSATLDHGVDALVKRFLPDAKVHAVSSVVSQVDTMTHHVFEVSQGNKHEVIRLLASGTGKRILFTRTKFQAKKMAKKPIDEGHSRGRSAGQPSARSSVTATCWRSRRAWYAYWLPPTWPLAASTSMM